MDSVEIIGNMAALGTAAAFALNSVLFTKAGRKIGAMPMNAIRIAMAVLLLLIAHTIFYGSPIPDAAPAQWLLIMFSGFLGLAVGDFFYFSTLVYLGSRRASLIMGSWPIFAAILAYIFLGETLGLTIILGIVLVTIGTTWVVLERKKPEEKEGAKQKPSKKELSTLYNDKKKQKKVLLMGVFTGLIGAFCQAIGYVYAKKGMLISGGLDPLPTTLIRMIAAFLMVWVIVLALGNWGKIKDALKDRKSMGLTFGGTFCGPFLGVYLSMVAAMATKIGIASTLMALTPILVIPMALILEKEKVTARAIVGAFIAFTGVAVLFVGDYLIGLVF